MSREDGELEGVSLKGLTPSTISSTKTRKRGNNLVSIIRGHRAKKVNGRVNPPPKAHTSFENISDFPAAIVKGTKAFECGFKWTTETRCLCSPYWGWPPNHQCRAVVLPGTVHVHFCDCKAQTEGEQEALSNAG